MATKIGRRKGSRNKGFFYREGRGWVTKDGGKFFPLTDEHGTRLRDKRLDTRVVQEAYARFLVSNPAEEIVPESATGVEVGLVCAKYLEHLRAEAGEIGPNPRGTAKTYVDRGQTLFDFCYGLPAEFFCNGDLAKRQVKGDAETKRIHMGYGSMLCSEITPAEIDAWLNAHSWKAGGRRTVSFRQGCKFFARGGGGGQVRPAGRATRWLLAVVAGLFLRRGGAVAARGGPGTARRR